MSPEQMDQLLNRLVQKLVDEGYINTEQQQANETGPGGDGQRRPQGRTSRSPTSRIDFLGFKTLKDLLGSLGQIELRRARYARPGHRRRDQRRGEALRVRRHAEPGHQRDAVLRHPARRR